LGGGLLAEDDNIAGPGRIVNVHIYTN